MIESDKMLVDTLSWDMVDRLDNESGGRWVEFHLIETVFWHKIKTAFFTRSNFFPFFTRSNG